MPGVRTVVLQSVRLAAQHQLPRRVAQLDAEVCAAIVHRIVVPFDARAEHHPLRPQTGEHPSLQPQTVCHQDRRLWQLLSARSKGKVLIEHYNDYATICF